MHTHPPATIPLLILLIALLLAGCQGQQIQPVETPVKPTPTYTPTATITASPTPAPTATLTFTITPVPPTHTPSITPTPTWVFNEPGEIVAPILLYHHVNGETFSSRYTVSIPDFQAQMDFLYESGYTAITMSMFLEALIEGRELPEKPIVITFDDGHQSVYDHAFPIMAEYGFPGVFYIVANRINNSPDFVNIEQLTTLINAGWEIGSHGYTHFDLTLNHASAKYEVGQSRFDLEAALGVKVLTFAYPYGKIDPFAAQVVNDSGYRAGIGLGHSITHTWGNLFYLQRIEVQGDYTLETFIGLVNPD